MYSFLAVKIYLYILRGFAPYPLVVKVGIFDIIIKLLGKYP